METYEKGDVKVTVTCDDDEWLVDITVNGESLFPDWTLSQTREQAIDRARERLDGYRWGFDEGYATAYSGVYRRACKTDE